MVEKISEVSAAIAETLKELATTDTIVGKPIEVGETTIIPVVSIMAGWGGGVGLGSTTQKGEAEAGGGGGGGGIRIAPVAFIVVKGDDVNLITLKEARLGRMAELIPTVIESIKSVKGPKDEEQAEGD